MFPMPGISRRKSRSSHNQSPQPDSWKPRRREVQNEQAQISLQAECLAGDGRGFVKAEWGVAPPRSLREKDSVAWLSPRVRGRIALSALTSLLVLHSGKRIRYSAGFASHHSQTQKERNISVLGLCVWFICNCNASESAQRHNSRSCLIPKNIDRWEPMLFLYRRMHYLWSEANRSNKCVFSSDSAGPVRD